MLSENNLELSTSSKAVYNLEVKRGVFWSKRRMELDITYLKYFDPNNNELRFQTRFTECEIKVNLKEKTALLFSNNNKFKEIKVSISNSDIFKSFIKDFKKFKSSNENSSQLNKNDSDNIVHTHEDLSHSEIIKESDNDEGIKFKSERKLTELVSQIEFGNPENAFDSLDSNLKDQIENFTNSTKSADYKLLSCKDGAMLEFSGEDKNIMNLLRYVGHCNSYTKKLNGKRTFSTLTILILIFSILILRKNFLLGYANENENNNFFNLIIQFLFIAIIFTIFAISFLKKRNISKALDKLNKTKGFFRISKILENDSKEIISCFNDVPNYPKWNINVEKAEYQSDSAKIESVNLTYNFNSKRKNRRLIIRKFQDDNNFKLKLKRIKRNNQIFDLEEKSQNIVRLITIEEIKLKSQITTKSSQNLNKLKRVNIYLPLQILINEQLIDISHSHNFIKSEIHSLSTCLQVYLKNESFNRELQEFNRVSIRVSRESLSQQILPLPLTSIKESTEEDIKQISLSDKAIPFIPHPHSDLYQTLENFNKKSWTIMEDKSDFKTYYFDESNGFRSVKAEATINKNIKLVFDYAANLDNNGQYDKNFDKGEIIRELDESSCIQYIKFKGKLMFAPRDFVIFCHKNGEEAFILCKNAENSDVPKYNKVERAYLFFGSAYLKKIDENRTYIVTYTLSDLKLSQYLANQALKDSAKNIKFFKEILDKL